MNPTTPAEALSLAPGSARVDAVLNLMANGGTLGDLTAAGLPFDGGAANGWRACRVLADEVYALRKLRAAVFEISRKPIDASNAMDEIDALFIVPN